MSLSDTQREVLGLFPECLLITRWVDRTGKSWTIMSGWGPVRYSTVLALLRQGLVVEDDRGTIRFYTLSEAGRKALEVQP